MLPLLVRSVRGDILFRETVLVENIFRLYTSKGLVMHTETTKMTMTTTDKHFLYRTVNYFTGSFVNTFWYDNLSQVTDDKVVYCLGRTRPS